MRESVLQNLGVIGAVPLRSPRNHWLLARAPSWLLISTPKFFSRISGAPSCSHRRPERAACSTIHERDRGTGLANAMLELLDAGRHSPFWISAWPSSHARIQSDSSYDRRLGSQKSQLGSCPALQPFVRALWMLRHHSWPAGGTTAFSSRPACIQGGCIGAERAGPCLITLWRGTMAFDLSQIDAGVRGLPLALLYALATAIALLALLVLRMISNSLPAKSPPVFEGTPFIGGIMKFVKVCTASEALDSFKPTSNTALHAFIEACDMSFVAIRAHAPDLLCHSCRDLCN